MPDLPSGAKFWKICSDSLRAAQLGQYGPSFTVDDLRKNLEEQAKAGITNWTSWKFALVSPEQENAEALIEQTCQTYTAWANAGSPPVQS